MTTISFIELGVEDAQKGRVFYESLFGWEFETGPSGKGWMINGVGVPAGMHPSDKDAVPYVFFKVDDLDAAIAKVEQLGGEIVPFDSGGDADTEKKFGRFKFCKDDQGSHFGLHEPPQA